MNFKKKTQITVEKLNFQTSSTISISIWEHRYFCDIWPANRVGHVYI